MKPSDNRLQIQTEYEDRVRRLAGNDLYSWFNPAHLFYIQQRQRAVLLSLKQLGYTDLANLRILEIGCGSGGVLAEFLSYGAVSHNLFGLDLLPDRLLNARQRLPGTHLLRADGSRVPFPEHSFDLVLQYMAISSVLDQDLRRMICSEMLRVLKPDGLILSYDFWVNPTNKQTRGLRMKEIKAAFPECHIHQLRVTLAPPISRRFISISWGLCLFLESLEILNTHYLATIQPPLTA
jgi:SAM-dependent methyltransferase